MCGIAGFVTLRPAHPDRVLLERMTGSLRHRGPDAEGFYADSHAALGHRRLSIIDLAAGAQPMANEDETLWIVYNGEVFNHADLRPELEAAGHHYRTRCDTETILHAYEEFGPGCLARFRGMFAFVIWNPATRSLFAARDRLGKKPFYYYWDGAVFVFASEIKAILEHPAVSRHLEESVLSEYLAFGYTSDERTLFAGIRKLMPGHYLQLSAAGLSISRYWEIPSAPAVPERRRDESWIEECRARLEETVKLRLMSDVPLGMFLSGGVDSSAIAAIMKRMVDGPVKTFSVGYREAEFSELSYAAQVARAIGTGHREIVVSRADFFNALPKLIWHEDEPMVWPSSVSLHFVSRLAAEEVKVVLTGEGSDEMFAGYSRYRFFLLNMTWAKRYRKLPRILRQRLRRFIDSSSLLSGHLRRKLGHSFLGREESVESLYLDNFFSAFSQAEQRSLLSAFPQWPDSTYDSYNRYWNARPHDTLLARMLYADQKTYLVELLMKQDQMSMSCSLESRVPFLDHLFVEFSTRVPDHLKIRNGSGKYILKRAVEDLLPREIIHRPKMGFPTPLRAWLSGPDAGPVFALLLRPGSLLAQYLDPRPLTSLLDNHRAGSHDATDRIWRLLNLQIWGEVFLRNQPDLPWEALLKEPASTLAS